MKRHGAALEETEKKNVKVVGVIITFRPNVSDLTALITSVWQQVSDLIIVNNGSREDLPPVENGLKIYNLQKNYGVAYAQNFGVKIALENGASHILLLDQDSVPEATMVKNLISAYDDLLINGYRVAAVGPNYLDTRQGKADVFVYREGTKLKRRNRSKDGNIVKVDFLIASGCMIPREAFTAVGFMEDDFFIDYVDIEWGLRAGASGWSLFGVYSANMKHSLGDKWVSLGKRKFPMHSALRNYYQFRNAISLCRRPWVTRAWRVVLIVRLVKQFLAFGIFAERRVAHIRLMTIGIFHGLIGRMGVKPHT